MSCYTIKIKELVEVLRDNQNVDLITQKDSVGLYVLDKFQLDRSEHIKVDIKEKLRRCFFNNYTKK